MTSYYQLIVDCEFRIESGYNEKDIYFIDNNVEIVIMLFLLYIQDVFVDILE